MAKHRRHSGGRRGFWRRLISPHGRGRRKRRRWLHFPLSLADIPAGVQVEVRGFRPMDPSQRQRLQAYGLSPGQRVRVIQQSDVTIIQAGHTELALEEGLSRSIIVESAA